MNAYRSINIGYMKLGSILPISPWSTIFLAYCCITNDWFNPVTTGTYQQFPGPHRPCQPQQTASGSGGRSSPLPGSPGRPISCHAPGRFSETRLFTRSLVSIRAVHLLLLPTSHTGSVGIAVSRVFSKSAVLAVKLSV